MKRGLKRALYAGIALLWIILLLVALEAWGGIARGREESSNPLIQAHINRGLFPPPGFLDELNRDAPALLTLASLPSANTASKALPRIAAIAGFDARTSDPLSAAQKAIDAWHGWSAEERNTYAIFRRSVIEEIEPEADERGYFGSWNYRVLAPPPSWPFAGARAAEEAETARSAREAISKGKIISGMVERSDPVRTNAFVVGPEGEENKALLINPVEPHRITEPIPEDSPWRVPYFSYEPNYRRPEGAFGYVARTNNVGFYDHDVALPKPQMNYRVLCIGGSTTEEGATVEETYPRLLERELRTRGVAVQGKSIEVINCGISGLTSEGIIDRLADYLALEPDLTIFYTRINDLHSRTLSVVDMLYSPFWKDWVRGSRFMAHQFPEAGVPVQSRIVEATGLTTEHLVGIRAFLESRGVPMLLCTIPTPDLESISQDEVAYYDWHARSRWNLPYWTAHAYVDEIGILNDELLSLGAERGIPIIPLAESIRGCGIETFADICHMTPEGIAMKARLIADGIESHLALSAPRTTSDE